MLGLKMPVCGISYWTKSKNVKPKGMMNRGLFKNKFRGHQPFCRATDTPVLDFWCQLPWVSKPVSIPFLDTLSLASNGFLRFTFGVTPTDLLMASIVVQPFGSKYLHICTQVLVELETGIECLTQCSLPNEPCRTYIHCTTLTAANGGKRKACSKMK